MTRSAILLGNEIDKPTSLGLPLWQRGWGDFKNDFLESLRLDGSLRLKGAGDPFFSRF
jgi:hypothetical protein